MKPTRAHATNAGHTYMVTSTTSDRQGHFRNERWARLFLDTLYRYRNSAYQLHEFVIMPDHIHILITPLTNLEKAVQFIKGGFSYRAKKDLGWNGEVWQKGFSDHRIRDARDYSEHIQYIRQNPVRARLCGTAEEFPYSSAHVGFELDSAPEGLKPESSTTLCGAAEAAPFQNESESPQGLKPKSKPESAGTPEGVPFQDRAERDGTIRTAPLHNKPKIA
jgi:putative transposase